MKEVSEFYLKCYYIYIIWMYRMANLMRSMQMNDLKLWLRIPSTIYHHLYVVFRAKSHETGSKMNVCNASSGWSGSISPQNGTSVDWKNRGSFMQVNMLVRVENIYFEHSFVHFLYYCLIRNMFELFLFISLAREKTCVVCAYRWFGFLSGVCFAPSLLSQ